LSVKADDTLAKCFHPGCQRYVTPGHSNGQYRYGLPRVLEALYYDCHAELLGLASGRKNAYTYLRDVRGIHPQVIADAMLGAVPTGYNVTLLFQPVLTEAEAAVAGLRNQKRGRPTKQLEWAEKRLHDIQAAQQKIIDCLAHRAGWLVFFYTDAGHTPVALRLRKPYSRDFVSFKPGKAGLFGRELFTPYTHPDHQAMNEFLVVAEGEVNVLALQSLTQRYQEVTGETLGYIHAAAVGSVTVADTEAVKRAALHPVIVYDNDANGAGIVLVHRVQEVMQCEACTTPGADSDLDSFITGFGTDAAAAWEGVKRLLAGRQPYGRLYSGTGEEFFRPTPTGGKEFIPRWLAEAIMARGQYRYAAALLWRYGEGVYIPDGEIAVREEAQALLGDERREHYLNEALRYIEVATRTDDPEPSLEYLNLRNGRLQWRTGKLEPHTSRLFETLQLPVAFDPDAQCPLFEQYLKTTFEADLITLAEEIMGYCLVPSTRFEKAIMLTGPGGNGKSTFIAVLTALLGAANVCHVALQDLEERRFHVAELYGKLANLVADLDARALKSSNKFKQIVTGDRLQGERKNQDPFYFRPYARLVFSANQIPHSADRTLAFYDRWIIMPFTQSFRGEKAEIKGLGDRLISELPGILNKAITGLRRLFERDTFIMPMAVNQAMEGYIKANDNVRAFVDECVAVALNDEIPKPQFYAYYRRWCEQRGERAVSETRLKDALSQAVPTLDERRDFGTKHRYWVGIGWTDAKWEHADDPGDDDDRPF
jgi:putative DNA primase/helicase